LKPTLLISKCQITRHTYKVNSAPFFKNECAYVKEKQGAEHRPTP
jgi:hypothetical protein